MAQKVGTACKKSRVYCSCTWRFANKCHLSKNLCIFPPLSSYRKPSTRGQSYAPGTSRFCLILSVNTQLQVYPPHVRASMATRHGPDANEWPHNSWMAYLWVTDLISVLSKLSILPRVHPAHCKFGANNNLSINSCRAEKAEQLCIAPASLLAVLRQTKIESYSQCSIRTRMQSAPISRLHVSKQWPASLPHAQEHRPAVILDSNLAV